MFCIKNDKSVLIQDVNTLDNLYDNIKERFKMPKYLQRVEYNGKSLDERLFEELKKQELVHLNLFFRFNLLDFNCFVSNIKFNNIDIKKNPILIKNCYYDALYCINPLDCENSFIDIYFKSINYNDRDVFLKLSNDTIVYWKCGMFKKDLTYLIDNHNNLNNIRVHLNDTIRGNGYIIITNVCTNTDEEIKRKLKFKIMIRNGLCRRCSRPLANQYVLGSSQGSYHLDCIQK